MKRTSLLTLLIFIFIAMTNVHAEESKMEKEILRGLDQIQKLGETKWSSRIQLENERRRQSLPERPRRFASIKK